MSETKVLDEAAYKTYHSKMSDGRSIAGITEWPKVMETTEGSKKVMTRTSQFWASLEKWSKKLARPLTREELLTASNIDEAAKAGLGSELAECEYCKSEVLDGAKDKTARIVFVPVKIALFNEDGELIKDKKTGEVVYAGSFLRDGDEIVGGCGSAFNRQSHLGKLRKIAKDAKAQDRKVDDRAMTYENVTKAIQGSQKRFERSEKDKAVGQGLRRKLFGGGKREHHEDMPGDLGSKLGLRPDRK